MLKVNHIASGSSGNAIVIDDGVTSILLDCGISYANLSRRVNVSQLAGCIITHEHADHCKSWRDLSLRGVSIYSSLGTRQALRADAWQINALGYSSTRVGSFTVERFDTVHDASEPIAVLCESTVTKARALYVTDTQRIDFSPRKLTHLIVECNYHELALDAMTNEFLKERIRRSHLSLETLEIWLRQLDLSALQEIHLVHLSDANADSELFQRRVQQITGVATYTIDDQIQRFEK